MKARLIGGILLIMGTTIGGGILALPIATAELGFVNAVFLLFFCWIVMVLGALLTLEVTLWLPPNTNLISMARNTLGGAGEIIAWLTCLLLLYSLLAAYIAAGSDFLRNLLSIIHIQLPEALVAFLFTLTFGTIVFLGIHAVDYANRGLMSLKFLTFFLLIALISPHVTLKQLASGNIVYLTTGVTVAVTSFGFTPIIPSLRNYFHNDISKLRFSIILGSFIPLVCYIAWEFVIAGVIPRKSSGGLLDMLHSGTSTSQFVNELSRLLQNETITSLANLFTSICLLTTFLGVALCLVDFLADGFRMTKVGWNNFLVCTAALIPPLLIVLFNPHIFIAALAYAGIYCVILLVILPALMVWSGRYYRGMTGTYRLGGGKILLGSLLVIATLVIIQSIAAMVIS